jgi:hypothetical protein
MAPGPSAPRAQTAAADAWPPPPRRARFVAFIPVAVGEKSFSPETAIRAPRRTFRRGGISDDIGFDHILGRTMKCGRVLSFRRARCFIDKLRGAKQKRRLDFVFPTL